MLGNTHMGFDQSVLTLLQVWKLPESKAWTAEEWLQAKGHKLDEAAPTATATATPAPAPSLPAVKAEGTTRRGTVIRPSSAANTPAAAIVERDIASTKPAAKPTGKAPTAVRVRLPCWQTMFENVLCWVSPLWMDGRMGKLERFLHCLVAVCCFVRREIRFEATAWCGAELLTAEGCRGQGSGGEEGPHHEGAASQVPTDRAAAHHLWQGQHHLTPTPTPSASVNLNAVHSIL